MSKFLKSYIKPFITYSPDEPEGGTLEIGSDPDATIDFAELLGEDDEPEAPAEEPLTMSRVTGLMDERFGSLEKLIKGQQPAPVVEPEPAPVAPQLTQPQGQLDPSVIARQTVKLQKSIMADITKDYPDLPQAAMDEIEAILDDFGTFEQLADARKQSYHMQIADSVAGKYIRTRKYEPAAFKAASAPVQTVGGKAPVAPMQAIKITPQDKEFIDIVEAALAANGAPKLTKDDYDRAQRHLKRVGRAAMQMVV